ncbi:MAG: AAA family ATPase [Deltaproteobacteria bacterium]
MSSKVIRLLEYLSALAKINASIIRDCDDYHKVLWIHDIPHELKHCFTRAWGVDENYSDDIWIEIRKCNEPKLPSIPNVCKDWVDPVTLKDISDLPTLQDKITLPVESKTASDEIIITAETHDLNSFPLVQKAWDAYLEQQWLPWADLYKRYLEIQKIYAELFSIYQEQQKLGEQYELVFCLGLLRWRQSNGQSVKRHLIVAKASLEFEAALGKFIVRASADGDQTEVEFDMLEVDAYPQNSVSFIEHGRKIRDNLWDRSEVDTLLKAIANSLADQGQGQYYPEALRPDDKYASGTPCIEYAPALVLRKRSMRGLIKLLDDMRRQIENGAQPPNEFLDLCESSLEKEETPEYSGNQAQPQADIYFPLAANEQQLQIIRKLDAQRSVLVQGPPGTGKSHTIANLICHLLATGQRVLVTAKTPQALQVLHDKIPSAVKPLCISLLGNGTEERESLERSVNSILANLDRWNEINNSQRIEEIEHRIKANRAAKSECNQKLIAVRERETYNHSIAGGAYTGTAAMIASRLRAEESEYNWLTDEVYEKDECPLSIEDTHELSNLLYVVDHKTEEELKRFFPDPAKDIPACEKMCEDFALEEDLHNYIKRSESVLASPNAKALSSAYRTDVSQLMDALKELSAEADDIRRRPMHWISGAVKDILTDHDTPWKELLRLSSERIQGMREITEKVHFYTIQIPEGMDHRKLLSDAKMLRHHFANGGKLNSFLFIKHKIIKLHGDLIGRVKVDGLDCLDTETLDKLIDYLNVEQTLNEVWLLWSGKAAKNSDQFLLQLAEIDELNEALTRIIGLYNRKEKLETDIKKIKGLSNPRFDESDAINNLCITCQTVLAQFGMKMLTSRLEIEERKLHTIALKPNPHLICSELLKSFRVRDLDNYQRCINTLNTMHKKRASLKKKYNYMSELATKAPILAHNLERSDEISLWRGNLKNLEKAWAWRRAKSWLAEFLKLNTDSLERNGKWLEEEIRREVAELSALKAWTFCFARMAVDHQRHLMAWQQAIRRLGRGTGKHAHTHRLNAQRHLNACKDAVPAWIMPLHRLYETVEAAPGLFDVIIVDEASQCGPESLPLIFLGRKIIVVGDEKQISPEAVGVDRFQVQGLMRTYLSDFVHADSFDVENSLFAHGRIRFGNRITLREHFRCMPEIIRFSNDLCYTSDPLIPLRQYPPDRLEPLKAIPVHNGYREGTGARVINRPEAEALVAKLVECCQDERYQGMTMGVIVLQGEAQAGIIENLLLKELGAEEMQKRRIICGNPYSFQGDEREIIYLSMVAAPNERIGALTQEHDMRRFNVAASRAQEQMWLFHSVTNNDLSEYCYRRKLLNHFYGLKQQPIQGVDIEALRFSAYNANRMEEKPPGPFDSWFEVDVALEVAGRGYRVIPQYEFADKFIDLVVQGNKPQLAVECDGDFWHGRDAYEADMTRRRMLERCGWHFFNVRESFYRANPEKALEILWPLLDRMGIYSQGQQAHHDRAQEEVDEELNHEDEDVNNHTPKATAIQNNEQHRLSFACVPESEKTKDTVNRLEYSRTSSAIKIKSLPENIQEALNSKSKVICRTIIDVLQTRPNNSCVRANMPTYILKAWNIRTRATPRDAFAKKIDDQIATMVRKGYLTSYRSVNERIKLGWTPYLEDV